MNLYIVRHAESVDSAAGLHQSDNSGLSLNGVKQAEAVAERLSKVYADAVLSSPMERARQTAEVISKQFNVEVVESDFFMERREVSEIEKKPIGDPQVVAIKKQMRENIANPDWRYSDEETFFELKDRAEKALEYLESLNNENVVLVSHGEFTSMLLHVMAFRDRLDPDLYLKLRNFMWDRNVGLTICRYDHGKWKMFSWNDFSHLG